jgi:voltage-gated potassium channel
LPRRPVGGAGRRLRKAFEEPVRRFQLALLILVGLVVIGTLGYMSGLMSARPMSWVDALYMTVITLTTVGFGEVEPLTRPASCSPPG